MITAFYLIREFERFCSAARIDGDGYALGFGSHYIDNVAVKEGDTITLERAETALMYDITDIHRRLHWLIKHPISFAQEVAITSFCYNVGIHAFSGSTMLCYINAGDFDKAAEEFDLWTHVHGVITMGLVRRRAREKEIFKGGDSLMLTEDFTCFGTEWIVVTDYVTGRMMRIQKDKILGYVDMKDGTGGELILDGFNYLGIKEMAPVLDRKMGIRVT